MTKKRAKRKLTAILSADVKGYSRLMGEDELATIMVLTEYRGVIWAWPYATHPRVVMKMPWLRPRKFSEYTLSSLCPITLKHFHLKNNLRSLRPLRACAGQV